MDTSPSIRKDLFGFTSIPFLKTIDSPYLDQTREDALEKLHAFLRYRGFAVVTGDTGCGKSMLLNHLCKTLHPNSSKIIYIPFSFFNERDMLRAICHGLEIEASYQKETMIHDIQNRIQEIRRLNPVLLLDEIQSISQQTLETVRLLCNFQFDSHNHFSLIMSGADSFLETLRRRINEPLRQRITLFINLKALSRNNTQDYIGHHIKSAGAQHEIIAPEAMNQIHDGASGIPRLINTITLSAIQYASSEQNPTVELKHVHQAMKTSLLPQREIKI
ncbi:MAG: ExeA family protein [bacterium]